jgi:hypothetical protein
MSFDRVDEEGTTTLKWRCDEGCGSTAEFDSDDFFSCWSKLKAQRWTAERDRNGEWLHTCPGCRKTVSVKEWLERT